MKIRPDILIFVIATLLVLLVHSPIVGIIAAIGGLAYVLMFVWSLISA